MITRGGVDSTWLIFFIFGEVLVARTGEFGEAFVLCLFLCLSGPLNELPAGGAVCQSGAVCDSAPRRLSVCTAFPALVGACGRGDGRRCDAVHANRGSGLDVHGDLVVF